MAGNNPNNLHACYANICSTAPPSATSIPMTAYILVHQPCWIFSTLLRLRSRKRRDKQPKTTKGFPDSRCHVRSVQGEGWLLTIKSRLLGDFFKRHSASTCAGRLLVGTSLTLNYTRINSQSAASYFNRLHYSYNLKSAIIPETLINRVVTCSVFPWVIMGDFGSLTCDQLDYE